jgi:hypothetical protein
LMRCITQRRRSSPEMESGQYCWTSASHFTSAICLARLSRGTDTPPRVVTEPASPAPARLSADCLVTPGIVRSSSGTRCASAIDEADGAEKSSSFDGKFAQMIVQTKTNPATEMERVIALPNRSSVPAVFIMVRIK